MSTLLLLISYEQKTQTRTVEIFDVVETVLAAAVWTTEYTRQLIFGFDRYQLSLRKTRRPGYHQRCPSPGDVMPRKMSYNPRSRAYVESTKIGIVGAAAASACTAYTQNTKNVPYYAALLTLSQQPGHSQFPVTAKRGNAVNWICNCNWRRCFERVNNDQRNLAKRWIPVCIRQMEAYRTDGSATICDCMFWPGVRPPNLPFRWGLATPI